MRRELGILLLLWVLGSTPVAAQSVQNEPERYVDYVAAQEQGFEILRFHDHYGTAKREMIDKQIVAPVMAHLAPGELYGFSFHTQDVNADEFEDVMILLKSAHVMAPSNYDGAAFLLYLGQEDGWRLAIEAGAAVVGLREAGDGILDIGLLQEEGVRVFSWNGNTYTPSRPLR